MIFVLFGKTVLIRAAMWVLRTQVPLKEQQVLLTAGPSFQPCSLLFFVM